MRSLRFQLIAWSAILMSLGLVVAAGIIYWRVSLNLHQWLDETVAARASEIEDSLTIASGQVRTPSPQPDQDKEPDGGEPSLSTYCRLWQGDFHTPRVLDPSPSMPDPDQLPQWLHGGLRTPKVLLTLLARNSLGVGTSGGAGPTSFRVLLLRLPAAGPAVGALEVGTPLSPLENTLARLRNAIVVVVPPVVFLLIGGSWVIISRAMQPLRQLGIQAASIGMEDMAGGLKISPTGDEVQTLAVALNEMMARLHAGFQKERQFTGDASHELRTPLAIMQSEIDLALHNGAGEPVLRETMETLSVQVNRMTLLVQGMLALARSDSGALQLEKERVRLDDLVEAVAEQSRILASEVGVRVDVGPLPSITAMVDEARLIQVLLNLVDNAIRHTPPGGSVSLSIQIHLDGEMNNPLNVEGNCLDQPGEVVCIVRDTGSGIAPEHLPHIFDRFYRADPSRTSKGAGLGLSIADTIPRAHGGRIEIESHIGSGTTARLALPLPAP